MSWINSHPPSDEDVRHVSEGLGGRLQLEVELPPQGIEPDLHRDPDTAAHISPLPRNLLVCEFWQKY